MPKIERETREELIARMEEELKELEEELAVQETRLEDADWEPKTDYEKPIDEIRLGIRDLRERFGEIESAGPSRWEEVYDEAQETLARLGDRLKTFVADIDNLILE